MCRSNDDTGFIYCGTVTNTNGVDRLHVIRTDNSYNTLWSYCYEVNGLSSSGTKIIGKPNNEYWVSGYIGTSTSTTQDKVPFVMKIDDLGNEIKHIFGGTYPNPSVLLYGVFLDVEPTPDDGCIAVGFLSKEITESNSPANAKRAYIVKFDNLLNVQWETSYVDTGHNHSPDNLYYDVAENVTVVGNEYFVTGSISYKEYIYNATLKKNVYQKTVPSLFYAKYDNLGNNIYAHSVYQVACGFDAYYDGNEDNFYIIGNFDVGPSGQASIICKVNFSTGALFNNQVTLFEGLYTNFPYPHIITPYKLFVADNLIYIYGYTRLYNTTSITSDNIMIPFRLVLNKSDYSQVSLSINHTDINRTNGYPGMDVGFLNATVGASSGSFSAYFPSVFAPEVACHYIDNNNNLQWAMVGYFDRPGGLNNNFELHCFGSENVECVPLDRDYSPFTDDANFDPPHIMPFGLNHYNSAAVIRTTLTLIDNSCE